MGRRTFSSQYERFEVGYGERDERARIRRPISAYP
jgi:hypothetical protein